MFFSNNCYHESKIEKSVRYICNCEYKYFLDKSNVTGVGFGYKMKNGFYTNQLCIQVFVLRKLEKNKLNFKDLIPNYYKGIITDVVQTGIFKTDSLMNKIRPAIPGYGIGNDYIPGKTGTFGCLVSDGFDTYILSVNHVLANNNLAPIGTKIIQPSRTFGGKFETDKIAILSKFIPIEFVEGSKEPANYTDCAIAKVVDKSLVSANIALVGMPKGIAFPRIGQDIKKVGASTELTTGKVKSLYVSVFIRDDQERIALFKNQIVTTKISTKGDSGSVLLDNKNNILGLIMSSNENNTIANEITDILKELGIIIITKNYSKK
ncbi:hypothetical protein Z959_13320 [Clostridium novyi B str. ATCC 27606]|uniref:Serine protease n=1 Tax=Clostridium novyi B str. ATCC 27606 TaxID=1443123 RepID=A0AA40IRM9_CLONO|nr:MULTISPECIES: trypsin-like serine protease [Clostridium]KEI08419.1 hypothetical protein Z958_13035 [Clostridium novyi B str. NCTC 9691]KEI11698.1 hypothetical protein Z959_13320 [Clostridium novyi B str. ATCC 27606]OOB76425.1 hypothetical protein AXF41_12265 [Clostridium haemolyticum]CAG7841143.1 hypothetical protein CLOHAE12215_02567 [Clostridium haemolyticum]